MRGFRHLLMVASVCLVPTLAAAQENAVLQLQQAIEQAVENNFELRAARQSVEIRRGEALHAARPVPSNPELEIEGEREREVDKTTQNVGIRVAQEFWIAGQGALGARAAEARTDAADRRLTFLTMATAARTRRLFLELLAARRAVETAESAVTAARDILGYAQRRLAAGEATKLEVNSAEISVARAESALYQARRDQEAARLQLARILGRDPARPLRIAGKLEATPLELPPRDELLSAAMRRRSDLAAAAAEVVAARQELRLSERQIIPNFRVFGFYRDYSSDAEEENTAGIGLSAPLPVFHRFGGERRASAAALKRAQVQEDAARLQVRGEVLQAVVDYRAARQRLVAVSERMLASAEENVTFVRRAFEAGKVAAPAITTAQDNLLNVRGDYLGALRDLIAAGTALERSTGGLIVMTQDNP